MSNIPPPFTFDELQEICNEQIAQNDSIYPGIGGLLNRYTKEHISKVDRSLYIPQPLMMIEDGPCDIGTYFPYMIAATRNAFKLVIHSAAIATPKTVDELSEEVINNINRVILLDGELENKVRGEHVLQKAFEKDPHIRCVGFSASDSNNRWLKHAGAFASVLKRTSKPENTMRELTTVLQHCA